MATIKTFITGKRYRRLTRNTWINTSTKEYPGLDRANKNAFFMVPKRLF